MCASRNGRPRTRSGSGPTVRRRWRSRRGSARESKLDRALVVAFALAEVLVEAGERVGLPGLMRPTGSRDVIDRMAEAIIHDPTERASLPPALRRPRCRRSWCCPTCGARSTRSARPSTQLSSNGAQGHLVQIVDPAEETFPYSGRIEFIEPEGAGEITAGRAENWRADYERAARAPPRRDPRRDRPARLELHHPPHRPRRRTNCCWRCMPASARATTRPSTNRRPHGMALGRSA